MTCISMPMNLKIVEAVLGILLSITAISSSFNSAYAKHHHVRVDCKDLSITLITWDQLLASVNNDDVTNIEDVLGDDEVSQVKLDVLVDRHLDELVDEVKDECDLNSHIDHYLDRMVLDVP
jgi:hypothetical protein